jgi:hypothetical protein
MTRPQRRNHPIPTTAGAAHNSLDRDRIRNGVARHELPPAPRLSPTKCEASLFSIPNDMFGD